MLVNKQLGAVTVPTVPSVGYVFFVEGKFHTLIRAHSVLVFAGSLCVGVTQLMALFLSP